MVLAWVQRTITQMEAAVVHDGTIHPGGAVEVVVEATRALDADLYVGFSGKQLDWWEGRVPNDVTVLRTTSRAGTINDIRTARSMLKLDLRSYDVVLTSGPAAKFFQPYDDQLHVHYIHHPPLSSLWYTGGLFAYLVKVIDRVETLSVPALIANSELTAKRVDRHYNREVEAVIPPPVALEKFSNDAKQTPKQLVMVGRLEERKRPTVAVDAMRELPAYTLKLIGDGPLRSSIERDAPENVEVLGYVDDETLRRTIERSAAGIFLAEREDFGITPIEYLAAGLPVVGVDEPNTNNQIDREAGVLVEPDAASVVDGIRSVTGRSWDRSVLRSRAEQYSTASYHSQLSGLVTSLLAED